MKVRKLKKKEIENALALAWSVFQQYEAPEYTQQGIDNFHHCLNSPEYVDALTCYGAFEGRKLIGMLATRNEGDHIALFFVDSNYHQQGIGKKLLSLACENNTSGKITVNSSPYAVNIYHHLGFTDLNTEQTEDGIRYTPMICYLNVPGYGSQ